jgi:SAM-dependent methyltransferase
MASSDEAREAARRLARESLAAGDPIGWFERLYAASGPDAGTIPWADLRPNPLLAGWPALEAAARRGGKALVVGCGLGDDAEALASRGLAVVAFDVAPSAIARCRERFPGSAVAYRAANLLAPPAEWARGFDLVFESYTLQALPPGPVREEAIGRVAEFVAPGGLLLLVARGREPDEDVGCLPWPLTRDEIGLFASHGLVGESLDQLRDPQDPSVRRFRAVLRR